MPVHFVINPCSAEGKTGRRWAEYEAQVNAVFPGARIHFTQAAGHASELAREIAHSGAELLVSVGGDGTNNEVLNGLFTQKISHNPNLKVASLPMGTGGDFIRTLGISPKPMEALRQIRSGETIQMDVGHLRYKSHAGENKEHYFLNITSFGMGGVVDHFVAQGSKRSGGKISYMMAALKGMFHYKARNVALSEEGQSLFQGEIANVAVANGCYFGGGMKISPGSQLDDGIFDVVVIEAQSTWSMIRDFRFLYRGAHLGREGIHTFKVKSLDAISEQEDVFLDVDGEALGHLPCHITCLPQVLKFVVGPAYKPGKS